MSEEITLPEAPEYALARALIEHLRGEESIAPCVMQEPWDREDQCQNLAVAANKHGLVLAVTPQPPGYLDADKAAAGYLEARLAVAVLSTTQVRGGHAAKRVSDLAGVALQAALSWDYRAEGIPYAAPKVLSVDQLDLTNMQGPQNLTGQAILIGRNVNYNAYYANQRNRQEAAG